MPARLPAFLVLAGLVAFAASCGPGVDLTKDLEVIDVHTGYTYNGLKEGKHHLLPTAEFRVRNLSDHDVSSVQFTVLFLTTTDSGPWEESRPLTGISSRAPLAPGAESDPFVVRSENGYTLEDPDVTTFFDNSHFNDVTLRVFASRSGRIVKIAEQQLERKILPQARDSGRP